jgi:integrase
MKALTDIAIRNLRAGPKRREIPDPGCRGLYVVVQPSGLCGFAVRYRFAGTSRKLTLPTGVGLAAARKLAAAAMFDVAQGHDPAETKRAARGAQRRARQDTFASVAAEYLERESRKPADRQLRTLKWRQQVLARHVFPVLGSRPVGDIKRSEIIRLLDRIEDGSGATMADRTLAIVRLILNWHAMRSDDFRSPIVRGMMRVGAEEKTRDRILTDDELRAVWDTAAEGRDLFDYLVSFLLLTGARKAEAARMEWDELADGVWTLPASRNKTKRTLVRPLSKAAIAVLDEVPRIAGSRFVFTGDGLRPLGGFTHRKQRFDGRCNVVGWTVHDLRRTARSLLSRAGVPVDHAEKCLGHVVPGIRATYDRHAYGEEMRRAYEALAAQVLHIVDPPAANVVPIHG